MALPHQAAILHFWAAFSQRGTQGVGPRRHVLAASSSASQRFRGQGISPNHRPQDLRNFSIPGARNVS